MSSRVVRKLWWYCSLLEETWAILSSRRSRTVMSSITSQKSVAFPVASSMILFYPAPSKVQS